MKIEIKSTVTEYRQLQTKNGPRDRYYQTAYLHLNHEEYPYKFRITHDSNTPLPPGFYTLDDSSYEIGRYGDLQLNPYEKKFIPFNQSETESDKRPLFGGKT